jgi:hypothetical protein
MAGFLSNVVGGVDSFANKIGSGISGLVQLPGAMYNAATAGNQATNAQNAAAGKSYIPNYNGAYAGQGIIGPNVNTGSVSSGVAGATAQNQNAVNSSGGVSSLPGYVNPASVSSTVPTGNGAGNTGTGNTASLQSQLAADQTALASAQAQQAALNQPATTGDTTAKVTYPGLVSTLGQTASQPSAQYTTAENNANAAQAQLLQLQSAQTQQDALIGGSRTNVSEAQGEAGLYNTQMIGQENAAATALAGYQNQAGIATGQQSAQQSGLAAAGALAAPQAGQNPLTQSYNPLTNSYSPLAISGAGANAATDIENYGSLQQQQAIGAAAAQNNSYLGGAQVAASNLQNLITTNNLNPSALTFANGALQLAEQYTSNPAYAKLPGAINDFVASLAPILGTGGNVTDMKTQMASQFVQMLQSGATINAVVQYFTDQAQQKITGMANGGGANISGTGNTQSNGTSGGSSSGSSVTAGGSSYVQNAQGQWVPAS